MKLQFGLLANLDNRRAEFFRMAVAAFQLPAPIEVGWEQLLRDSAVLAAFRACDVVRIDSWGEHAGVHDQLAIRGGAPKDTHLEFGELAFMAETHRGFCEVLTELSGYRCLSSPADVVVMFDKWETHRRLLQVGVRRPETRTLPATAVEFFAALPPAGRWFLKPRHGSSASGVCAFRWHGDQMVLTAPIELARAGRETRLFNSLKVRRYTRRQDISDILVRLLTFGMIAEEWVPKARLQDLEFDLRVVVIAGRARHMVVRQSRYPMTNLHLGNQRGDLALAERTYPSELAQCRVAAETAMLAFGEAVFAGVDVLLARTGEVYVCEVNAFGDLLPGVVHEGESTYEAIVRAALQTEAGERWASGSPLQRPVEGAR